MELLLTQVVLATRLRSVLHPHFASREGFVRANVKYQGLVGVPLKEGALRPAGTWSRLTWLVNVDFGGSIPVEFVQSALLNSMFLPRAKVIEMESQVVLLGALEPRVLAEAANDEQPSEEAGSTEVLSMPAAPQAIGGGLRSKARHQRLFRPFQKQSTHSTS